MELEKVFSLDMNEEHDQVQIDAFLKALKNKASRIMNNDKYNQEPFNPGVAYIAFKGHVPTINYEEPNWWTAAVVRQIELDFKKSVNQDVSLKYKEKDSVLEADISRAFYLMEKVWPEAKIQVNQIVTDIVALEGEEKYNGSSGWAYGVVFVSHLAHLNAVHMMESLIHESGHLSLMTKQAFGKMIINNKEKVYSPLRKEERWLNGVLHASFVTWRVCEGLRRLTLIGDELTVEEKESANDRYKVNFDAFKDSLINLDSKAEYTEAGELFVSQLRENLKKLEKNKTSLFLI